MSTQPSPSPSHLRHQTPFTPHAFAYSNSPHIFAKLALSSFSLETVSAVTSIISSASPSTPFSAALNIRTAFTPTSLAFAPTSLQNELADSLAIATNSIQIFPGNPTNKLNSKIEPITNSDNNTLTNSSSLSTSLNTENINKDYNEDDAVYEIATTPLKTPTCIDWHPFSPNLLGCSSLDGTANVWDIDKSRKVSSFSLHSLEATCFSFLSPSFMPNALLHLTSSVDGTLWMADCRNNKISSILNSSIKKPITKISWKTASNYLISFFHLHSKEVMLFDLRMPNIEFGRLSGHEAEVVDAEFSPFFAQTVVSVDEKGKVLVWDVNKSGESEGGREGGGVEASLGYSCERDVSGVGWSRTEKNWIGFVGEDGVEMMKL